MWASWWLSRSYLSAIITAIPTRPYQLVRFFTPLWAFLLTAYYVGLWGAAEITARHKPPLQAGQRVSSIWGDPRPADTRTNSHPPSPSSLFLTCCQSRRRWVRRTWECSPPGVPQWVASPSLLILCKDYTFFFPYNHAQLSSSRLSLEENFISCK